MSIWTTVNHLDYTLRHVDVGPWHTRVLDVGTGPALILMHGTGGHLEAFTHNLEALSREYRVIAYDFPGHGYTTFTDHDLEIAEYVAHLKELMSALGVEKAHLCGESLGGWVALKFAATHPDLVDRLVLNTPGGTMATPEVMHRIRTLSQAAADNPTPEAVRTRLEWLMADPATVTDELVEVRRGVYSQPGFADSMRHILCLQDPEIRARNLVSDEDFAAIEAPAIVIWTSDDPSGPAGAGLQMAEAIPQGEFQLIEGAGHWPQWEQHATYNKTMLEFLARNSGSTP
ncbi:MULTISPECIES: alpha/beta fold hydrolase [unclassified Nocardioides]|uniref:alpha/beta fold hydrolase n=1 Tax=unclassified Nocardioides TaxID=2615069 RepID=UPI0009F0FD26|nr:MULTISPECIES: alpha/beta fold hydrolase [unclassified Nocardioides]GAW48959.1 alpha/beta hydrolase fold protein [Nocardioides sp. PD653-B2]GAW55174.1 alpha/beta hydrolase fold protein [Nocardioides sp. PD653]